MWSEKLEVQQSKGEAEISQIDWLIQYLQVFNKHEMCLSIVYSGDIDALILHMFTLSYLWPRDCNDEFKHEVFLLLVKPTTKDLYNITAIIRLLEKTYKDKHMALKMAIYLCIGGYGFIPKFYQITHKSFVERIPMSVNVRSGLIQITVGDEQGCRRCRIQMNKELYKELIKEMYCPKYLYPSPFTFDEVRQMSVQLPQKSGSNEYRHARDWVAPASTIEEMCELLQCYC